MHNIQATINFTKIYLTHWGWDKIVAISQTTFSNAFSWMKIYEFRLRYHWSLFLGFALMIIQHWFRYWLGADQGTSHYMNQWWLVYWCIYASLGLNEFKRNTKKWGHPLRWPVIEDGNSTAVYNHSRYLTSSLDWNRATDCNNKLTRRK